MDNNVDMFRIWYSQGKFTKNSIFTTHESNKDGTLVAYN